MTDHPDYTSLIERLEKAEGPDADLDCAIHITLFGWKLARIGPDYDGENACEVYTETGFPVEGFAYPPKGKLHQYFHLRNPHPLDKRNYTASLDAALALVERVLPGLLVGFRTVGVWAPHHKWAGKPVCEAMLMDIGECDSAEPFCAPENRDEDEVREYEGKHCTPALALLIALLKAKQAQP